MDRQRGEPQVEIAVEANLGKPVDDRRQAQGALVAPGELDPLADTGDALQQSSAGAMGGGLRRLRPEPAIAAQGAEENTDRWRNVSQVHGRLRVTAVGDAGDYPVPECADVLFQIRYPATKRLIVDRPRDGGRSHLEARDSAS